MLNINKVSNKMHLSHKEVSQQIRISPEFKCLPTENAGKGGEGTLPLLVGCRAVQLQWRTVRRFLKKKLNDLIYKQKETNSSLRKQTLFLEGTGGG